MDNIRPIRTDEDYDWAISEITKYFEKQPEPGTPDGDRFDVLATLIEAFENAYHPIQELDPVDAIAAHMEMNGLKQRTLAEVLGSSSRASEILKRKRPLTVEMIHKIASQWGIPADLLVRPYHLVGSKTPPTRRSIAPQSRL